MSEKDKLYTEFVDSFNLQSEDIVFISSDISNYAKYFKENGVAFEVNTFVNLLQSRLNKGTLIFPAYTDNLRNGDIFDYRKAKPTTGALSKRIAQRKDFARSYDPLHSVYVWGKKSEDILKLKDESSFGENSVFGFLARANAKFIFIDVDLQNSFTFIHYLEEKEGVNYRKYYSLHLKLKNREELTDLPIKFHTKKMGISTQLKPLQDFLIANRFLLEIKCFNTNVYISDADQMTKGVYSFLSGKGKMYRFDFKLFTKQVVKKIFGKSYF